MRNMDDLTVMPARQPAIVIGAGLAGIGAAWRLARSGRDVVLLEKEDGLCAGASGNPASVCAPYYADDARGKLLTRGLLHTLSVWRWLEAQGHTIEGERCGVLVLDSEHTGAKRLAAKRKKILLPEKLRRDVSALEASQIAQVSLPVGGAFYSQGGWLNMRSLSQALLENAGQRIDVRPGVDVRSVTHDATHWRVESDRGKWKSDTVVLANAASAKNMLPNLPIFQVEGKLFRFAAPPQLSSLATVLQFGHALAPPQDGTMTLGSLYMRYDTADAQALAERELWDNLGQLFPSLDTETLARDATSWQGWRCTNRSRVPLVGLVTHQLPGLYLHTAHGSRGSLTGLLPLSAQTF